MKYTGLWHIQEMEGWGEDCSGRSFISSTKQSTSQTIFDWLCWSGASPRWTHTQYATGDPLNRYTCRTMQTFKANAWPNGTTTAWALKVTAASGLARRFVVGDDAKHNSEV